MRALLVEDDEMNLRLYQAGLEREGISFRRVGEPESTVAPTNQINVVIATTLNDALSVLDDGVWDMVISDLKFPKEAGGTIGQNGIAMVTEALRRGVQKVYLNTSTGIRSIEGVVPNRVVVLPEKLILKTLNDLLLQEAARAT